MKEVLSGDPELFTPLPKLRPFFLLSDEDQVLLPVHAKEREHENAKDSVESWAQGAHTAGVSVSGVMLAGGQCGPRNYSTSQSELLNKGTVVPVKTGFEVDRHYFVSRPAG